MSKQQISLRPMPQLAYLAKDNLPIRMDNCLHRKQPFLHAKAGDNNSREHCPLPQVVPRHPPPRLQSLLPEPAELLRSLPAVGSAIAKGYLPQRACELRSLGQEIGNLAGAEEEFEVVRGQALRAPAGQLLVLPQSR